MHDARFFEDQEEDSEGESSEEDAEEEEDEEVDPEDDEDDEDEEEEEEGDTLCHIRRGNRKKKLGMLKNKSFEVKRRDLKNVLWRIGTNGNSKLRVLPERAHRDLRL